MANYPTLARACLTHRGSKFTTAAWRTNKAIGGRKKQSNAYK